jgi:hypothetical protein
VKRTVPFLALVLLLLPQVRGQEPRSPLVKVGEVAHPFLTEMSGIARSQTYENVWWVHNDSGDTARIFAIDGAGNAVIPPFLADRFTGGEATEDRETWPGIDVRLAENYDWEDIALADGRLYIADVGNNGNARRDLGVYVVNEPNPRAVERTRTLRHLPVRFPDQARFPAREWHFDCEGVFYSEGRLYFLTKHRAAGQIMQGKIGTKLYRLDTEHTDRENVLTLIQSREDLALPTAADLSPDGRRLAVLTARALWVFSKPASGDHWLAGKARRLLLDRAVTKSAEGVTWDDDETLRICNEQGELYVVGLEALPPVE